MILLRLYSVRLEYRLPSGPSFIRNWIKAHNQEFALDIAYDQAAIQFCEWGYASLPTQDPIIEIFDITDFVESYMGDRETNVGHMKAQLERAIK